VGCRGGWVSDEHEVWISMLAVCIHIVLKDTERDIISYRRDSVVLLTCVFLRLQSGG
jgi:hypothetical protein